MELTYPAWEIRIPLERPCFISSDANDPRDGPRFPVARFQLTKEHSWPPVYRQVIDEELMK